MAFLRIGVYVNFTIPVGSMILRWKVNKNVTAIFFLYGIPNLS